MDSKRMSLRRFLAAKEASEEMLLQGPLSDAMTHAGQLAILWRLAGSPIPPENFVFADISPENLGPDQPLPVCPDKECPEAPDNDKPRSV